MSSTSVVRRYTWLAAAACAATSSIACSDDSAPPGDVGGNAGASAGGGAGGGGAGVGGFMSSGGGGGSSLGGAGGAPVVTFTPVVLFSFDPTATGVYGWSADPSTGGSVTLVSEDRDPSSSTPGALRFVAAFPPYDTLGASSPVSVLHEFGNPTTGTNTMLQGGTRVHFWIRLVSPVGLPPSLAFFQPFIQGGAATGYSNNFFYNTPEVLTDNLWHEFIIEVAGQTFMNDVWRVGVQLTPQGGPPNGGAADAGDGGLVGPDAGADGAGSFLAPAPITLDIDYVWVE